MKTKGKKDLAIIYMRDALEKYSDSEHPMRFSEIEDILRYDLGIDYDRRTVADKMNLLINEGPIKRKSRKSGAYFDDDYRAFDKEELNLLIYSVMANRNIPYGQARNLAERIAELGGEWFKEASAFADGDVRRPGGNEAIFTNLEDIRCAIRSRCKISFDYYRYDRDGELHMSETHNVSPYYVTMKNQDLYMLAYSEKHAEVTFFRVDKIKNVVLLDEERVNLKTVPGYEAGIDFGYLRSALPYMFSDKPEQIAFSADESMIDQIVDWFGTEARFSDPSEDGTVIANVKSSPMAIECWAKQYLDSIEIISPPELRKRIHESLINGTEKYRDDK